MNVRAKGKPFFTTILRHEPTRVERKYLSPVSFSWIKNVFAKVLFDFKGQKFTVNCQADEKLNDVIKQCREKSNDLRSDIFIFNSKRLNLNRTIEEEGISKGSLIIVPAQNLSGGGE